MKFYPDFLQKKPLECYIGCVEMGLFLPVLREARACVIELFALVYLYLTKVVAGEAIHKLGGIGTA